ncbi:MAG: VOC family protein [Ignavibacteria bacterium]|nr:VOC family protein [Ignavibacteria bacterium]
MNLHTGHIELFVKDPISSLAFYKDILEFELIAVQHTNFIWICKDSVEILLRPGSNDYESPTYSKARVGLVFYTDNLEKTAGELAARGVVICGTVDSEKCLTFKDPDGNWFQLVNPNDH